jgi:hypothetical protein
MTRNEPIHAQPQAGIAEIAATHVRLLAQIGTGALLTVAVIVSCLGVLLLPEPSAPRAVPVWRGGTN